MLKKLAFIGLLLLAPISLTAQDNEIKIVALVLTTANYSPGTDNIVASLETLDAQVLHAESLRAPHIRSAIKRFAQAALENDIALVFVDGPVLEMDGRFFLVPFEMDIQHGSDLLTGAIPVLALARAAALAQNGGAVFLHAADLGQILPDGVALARTAPDFQQGTSPILLGQAGSAMEMARLFEEIVQNSETDITRFMSDTAAQDQFSVSFIPAHPVFVKKTAQPVIVAAPVIEVPVIEEVPGDQDQGNLPAVPVGADAVEPLLQDSETEITNTGIETGGDTGLAPDIAPDGDTGSGLNLPQIQTPAVQDALSNVVVETQIIQQDEPMTVEMLKAMENDLSRDQKRVIQESLRDLGFYRGLIDGVFGNQTKFAIEDFQRSIGAPVIGVLTLEQLENFVQ